jgi:hypothetical protein
MFGYIPSKRVWWRISCVTDYECRYEVQRAVGDILHPPPYESTLWCEVASKSTYKEAVAVLRQLDEDCEPFVYAGEIKGQEG